MPIRRVCLGLAMALGACCLAAAPLRVGVERVEMEFPRGLDMWGYTPRPNQGVRDPLYARIFVFDSGDRSVALVTLDLGRTFAVPQLERVRDRVRRSAGVDDVIFTASHTHSGPYLRDLYPDGTPEWENEVVDRLTEGIESAASSTFEARIGAARGRVEIGHNRRFVRADGSVKMLWANPTRISTFPVDPEVVVLRIDDERGRVRGVLVGYACHPVIFGPDNLEYSADFPGAMSRRVGEILPGSPVVAFIQGGAGDINPFMDKRELPEDAVRSMVEAGTTLGEEVARVAAAIQTEAPSNVSVQEYRETITMRTRPAPPSARRTAFAPVADTIEADLTVLLVAGTYAFVGLPGEPFVEFQLDLKRRFAALDAVFLMGYTNGYVRYFPTIRAAVEGGYGADRAVSIVEVGAGERMMRRAYVELWHMTGRLGTEPER